MSIPPRASHNRADVMEKTTAVIDLQTGTWVCAKIHLTKCRQAILSELLLNLFTLAAMHPQKHETSERNLEADCFQETQRENAAAVPRCSLLSCVLGNLSAVPARNIFFSSLDEAVTKEAAHKTGRRGRADSRWNLPVPSRGEMASDPSHATDSLSPLALMQYIRATMPRHVAICSEAGGEEG